MIAAITGPAALIVFTAFVFWNKKFGIFKKEWHSVVFFGFFVGLLVAGSYTKQGNPHWAGVYVALWINMALVLASFVHNTYFGFRWGIPLGGIINALAITMSGSKIPNFGSFWGSATTFGDMFIRIGFILTAIQILVFWLRPFAFKAGHGSSRI